MANESVPMNKRFGEETDIEAKAKKFVLGAYKKYSDRTGLEEIWEESDRLYNCISTEKHYVGVADLFPPETRRACKTLINFIDEILFSPTLKYMLGGVGGARDDMKAKAITSLLEKQQSKCRMRMNLRRMLEDYLVKYGVAIVRAVWRVNERKALTSLAEREKMKRMLGGEDVGDIAKESQTTYDNADFQVKDIHSMYWNYFKPWEEQKIIIERSEVDESHLRLMERAGIYKNIDAVLAETGAHKRSTSEQPVAEKFSHIKELTGLSGGFDIEDSKAHEILEAECNFDLDGDGLDEECVITIADKEHVIRLEPNPYDIQEKSYLWVCWEPIAGTSLGQGVPQLCKKSQAALNDFTNQIMDNITAILDCMKVVDSLAEIPDIQLKSRPNGIIHSKAGVEAVKFLPPELTASEGLKAVAMAREDIRTASGATMSLQGMPARYGTTASEYQAQGNSSARDVFSKVREIEDRITMEAMRRFYQYDLQFMSREEFIKILGEKAAIALIGRADGMGESPKSVKEAIIGDYDFIPLGATQAENRVIKGQQIINFINLVMPLPPGIVNLPKMIAKAWKYVGDEDDILLPQASAVLVSPQDENILLAQGEAPQVNPMDPHQVHIRIHQMAEIPPELEPVRQMHIAEHGMALQMSMQRPGGQLPPQEQARMGPDIMTPQSVGEVPGAPQESY